MIAITRLEGSRRAGGQAADGQVRCQATGGALSGCAEQHVRWRIALRAKAVGALPLLLRAE